jgi:two-component system sensor histidine kinase HydH
MASAFTHSENPLLDRLKWLMFLRVLFSAFLLGSTVFVELGKNRALLGHPLLPLYGLTGAIFLLTVLYIAMLTGVEHPRRFAYLQITVDTLTVSLIICVTGGYVSIFTFLYLVVVIYSSLLIERKGSMIMASLCAGQYTMLIVLEYYGRLSPLRLGNRFMPMDADWRQVTYKILVTAVACYAVAFLSGVLAEQTRRSKQELISMQNRMKRVQKLAAMGEMAAGLAHEIKNPLASLSGSIQLLRDDIPPDPVHDRLMQIVLRETDRLSGLVTDFLMFAKPPAGKAVPIELDQALRETVELFAKDAAKTISISQDLVPRIWIAMDPAHLRQVLWNLLLNAAEAIEGAGHIRIQMIPGGRQNPITVRIADDGCGMSKDILQCIFDPFFTTKSSGTGLGLSIVHSILESYDSWLDVESQPGKGTAFSLKLKRIDPPTRG